MSSSVNLLWWIAIGLLFFWLMLRGGCGAGMSRSRTAHGKEQAHKPRDPVCGMEVDPAKAAGTRVVGDETYFLCSQTCLDAFDKDAAMYAHREHDRTSQGQHQHAGC